MGETGRCANCGTAGQLSIRRRLAGTSFYTEPLCNLCFYVVQTQLNTYYENKFDNTAEHAVEQITDRPRQQTPDGIYLIKAGGTSLYKIGIAKDFKNRQRQLTSGSPHKLELLCYKKVGIAARSIEQGLHVKYKSFKHLGEWFELTELQAQELTELINSGSLELFSHCEGIPRSAKQPDRL